MDTGFGWLVLAVTVYGVIHSVFASLTLKAWVENFIGKRLYQQFYRFFYVILVSVTLLPILLLIIKIPDSPLYLIPPPWSYLTTFIEGLCVLGIYFSLRQTDLWEFMGIRQLFQREMSDKKPVLITTGSYRWVRHPLYTFGLIFTWLLPVMSWNILVFNLAVTIYILVGIYFEEKKLLQEFGAAYADYKARTPALIPFFKIK